MNTRSSIITSLVATLLVIACSKDDHPKPRDRGDAAVDAATNADAGVADAEADAGPPPSNIGFRGVWGTSANDVWIVGGDGDIVHFDGQAFTKIDSGTTSALSAVHGTSPTDVWTAGEEGTTLHWDGTSFTQVAYDDDE
ncbi:MAG TPA: hypothetical protein VHZ95_13480, partial [Polyangiales bacterium]|nr:hypothetical protein [Polyangiales bacterium]